MGDNSALLDVRNAAFLTAEAERAAASRSAQIEYSETVAKLREQFEGDLGEATRRYCEAVCPVHRRYNAAIIEAELRYRDGVRSN